MVFIKELMPKAGQERRRQEQSNMRKVEHEQYLETEMTVIQPKV